MECFPGSSAEKRIHLQCTWFDSWVRKIPWRRDRLPTPISLDFPCGSAGKEPACNVGDLGLITGLGRSPREGKGYPLQYSGLEKSMDYGSGRIRHDWVTFTFTIRWECVLTNSQNEVLRTQLIWDNEVNLDSIRIPGLCTKLMSHLGHVR